MKRYAEYKESGIEWIGIIPVSWDVSKSKYHYISNDGGVWGNEPENDGTDVIVLRSTEQTVDGKWIIEDPAIRSLKGQKYQKQLLKENDLVMTKSSGSNLHIGKTSIVTAEIESMQCCYSNFMQRIRISDKDNPKFFWYFLNSTLAREQFVFLQNSTSGLGNINSENINSLWVPHICKEQQDRIVLYLDQRVTKIDRLISEKESLISLLLKKRTSTICIAVTKGIDPAVKMKQSGFEWLGEVPAHWRILTNHQLFAERNIKCNEPDAVLLSVTKHLGVILQSQAEELNLATVAPAETTEGYKVVRKGDLVMNIMRAKDGSYGISDYDGVISPAYCIYYTRQEANPQYLYYLFKTPMYMEIFKNYSTGIAEHRMRLYPVNFFKIPAVVPPLDEQNEIVAYLDKRVKDIDELITLTQQQIEKLKEYRQSIISEVVTGKVAVE